VNFPEYFSRATGLEPHPWQAELGADVSCQDRLVRIPTGFGKTLGVLSAWLHHRVSCGNQAWPRRLVWCLPMRVLVEQTHNEICQVLSRLGQLWNGQEPHQGKVGVHLLMGGTDSGEWHLHPEQCAVLIGTQDMLLSRALNRGYAAHRARWPIDFGLLNQDCLWVMDEVQLMDVGLATSGQLQSFRRSAMKNNQLSRPCSTWWMSATLQRDWLTKSPETAQLAAELSQTSIPMEGRTGHLWEDVRKPVHVEPVKDPAGIARLVLERHLNSVPDTREPTLVVVNRVDTAVEVYKHLKKDKRLGAADVRLVHSRFRPIERDGWGTAFLNRQACVSGANRIIVATQVIEAGVDLSASVLLTELAPWPSLVQRFGRAARWGGEAQLVIMDRGVADDKAAAPYTRAELDAALVALAQLPDGSPAGLESFEANCPPKVLSELYPYTPTHLLMAHELDDLFDTTPDLSGADIDISRFIRSGDERDVQIFWLQVPDGSPPDPSWRASREMLCSAPFLRVREWLCGKTGDKTRQLKPALRRRAWVWDWLDGSWKVLEAQDIYPGQTILVDARAGGYDPETGWDPESTRAVSVVMGPEPTPEELADATESDEHLSVLVSDQPVVWQTIATHGAQVGAEASGLGNVLCPNIASLLGLAGRWHDLGKAHGAFQNSIVHANRPDRSDVAKAPADAWKKALYVMQSGERRQGFRHELASVLGLFGVLRRNEPYHAALLGPWREMLPLLGGDAVGAVDPVEGETGSPSELEKEILALNAGEFDLLAYLVCSHHGKVRLAWHTSPADQDANDSLLRIRGVREGDRLPQTLLATAGGNYIELPETELSLSPAAVGLSVTTGRSWTDRILGLVRVQSAFQLAYLEAVLRAADIRASRSPVADSLLNGNTGSHELEREHSSLAGAVSGGETASRVGTDPGERRTEHGVRRRAGGPATTEIGTRPPASATRFIESSLGRLSYAELAAHIAERVAVLEARILNGDFDDHALDEHLIVSLQRAICESLTPQLAGFRTVDVVVGSHTPPGFFEVRVRMCEYANDLGARLAGLADSDDELLLELLAFAEGRLLSIHPFADFNGRVTRVFLRLLLRRLVLPNVRLVPDEAGTPQYLEALRAGDRMNWAPLKEIWRGRFSSGDLQ